MNIVITGTSRGIGLELTAQALKRGDRVFAIARKPEESRELQALKSKYGAQLETGEVELAGADVEKQVDKLLAQWPSVDVLINNAGIYREGEALEDFLSSFQVNSVVPLYVTRALFPQLKKSKNPIAMHVTSLMGSIGDNESGGSYAYRASKAALNMINKSLSQDESWLTTCVVHPGWVQTRMGGAGAPTPVTESAAGIWKVILGLKPQDSGSFFDFEGEKLPW